jgi:hypothetical protein
MEPRWRNDVLAAIVIVLGAMGSCVLVQRALGALGPRARPMCECVVYDSGVEAGHTPINVRPITR